MVGKVVRDAELSQALWIEGWEDAECHPRKGEVGHVVRLITGDEGWVVNRVK